jgi:hypothetical protein
VILHERGVARTCPSGAELAIAITKVDDRTGPLVDRLIESLRFLGPAVRVLAIAALTADR